MRNRIAAIALSLFLFIPSLIFAAQTGPDGSLNHSVNIQLPPGTNGVKPNLSLDYNSNAGNGIAGQGWSLNGLPIITRDSRFGIRYDATDTYCGRQGRLVYQKPGEYHYEYEDYSKVEIHGTDAGNPDYWVDTRADGTKYYYGNYGDAESANVEAVISDSNGNPIEGKIRVWALSRVEDIYGNYYTVTYIKSDGEFYPDKIVYTQGSGISKLRTVEFVYQARSDYSEEYAQSGLVITKNRLSEIVINVDVTEFNFFNLFTVDIFGDKVRSYVLEYLGGTSGADYSRLDKIEVYGSSSGLIDSETFTWTGDLNNIEMNQPLGWVDNYGYTSDGLATRPGATSGSIVSGWGTSKHRRFAADVNGDGRDDIVGFGDTKVYVSESTGTGFEPPEEWITDYTPWQGWDNTNHPRMMADVNGDGKADIVGFFNDGVYVSFSTGTNFTPKALKVREFCYNNNWRSDRHPRVMADVDGDGRSDVVGFANAGVYVAYSIGESFKTAELKIGAYCYNKSAGSWRVEKNPRMMADVNGDGRADIVGFGNVAVYVSLSTGSGFGESKKWVDGYGYSNISWRLDEHIRVMADVNGDRKADVVGFGDSGVHISLSTGAYFAAPQTWIKNYAYDAGSWRMDKNPRMMADVNGDGKADIVGIANSGICISLSNGISEADGKGFTEIQPDKILNAYGLNQGWSVDNHPRKMADVDGDGKSDIVGFFNFDVQVSTKIPQENKITKIVTFSGMSVDINYKNAVNVTGAIQSQSEYPIISNTTPRMLVDYIETGDGRGNKYRKEYSYTNGRIYMGLAQDRKNLYFETITEKDTSTGISVTTTYEQTDPWLAGCPLLIETTLGSRSLKEEILTYDNSTATGYTGTHTTRLLKRSTTTYVNGAEAYTVTQTNTFDDYCNITQTVETADGLPTIVTTTEYDINTGSWILRRPSDIKKYSDGNMISNVTFQYDGVTKVTASAWLDTDGSLVTTTYDLDANGNIAAITDPMNRITTLEYDSDYRTFVTRVTNPMGHVVTAEYDPGTGNRLSGTDANGNTFENSYDSAGRITAVFNAYGDQVSGIDYHDELRGQANGQYIETMSYDDFDNITNRSMSFYDGLGRVYKTVTRAGTGSSEVNQVSEVTLNSAGLVATKTIPHMDGKQEALTITYGYDSELRVNRETRPDGKGGFTEVGIDYSAGTGTVIVKKTDAKGGVWTSTYDAQGRIIRKSEPLSGKITYTYDAAGRLAHTNDSGNNITSIIYDSLGRKRRITDPNAGTVEYTYDKCGNVLSKTDAKGNTVTYTYDNLNRVTYIDYSDSTPDVTYVYDESSMANGKGRVTSVTDGTSASRYAYDSNGNMEYSRQSVDNMDFIFTMTYDRQNRLESVIYPDGAQIDMQYADMGYLQAVSNHVSGGAYVQYGLAKNTDGSYRNAVQRSTGNGIDTLITFNPANNRPVSVESRNKENQLIENNSYEYDLNGNIEKITNALDNTKTQTFTYDAMNRLTKATGIYGTEEYEYTNSGNLIRNKHGVLQYNDPDHPYAVTADGTGKTYSYDDNGNMILRGEETLRWDAADRLAEIEKNGTVTQRNRYDHTGHRVVKELNNGTTVYNIGGLYELTKAYNRPDCHTKYIYGLAGDTVAQVTQTGVSLVSSAGLYDLSHDSNRIIASACSFITAVDRFASSSRNIKQVYWVFTLATASGILLVWLYVIAQKRRREEEYPVWASAMSVIISMSMLMSFTGCDIPGVPGLDDIVFSGAADTGGLPEQGTYYFHPDHLGSTSYLTDAAGQVVTRMYYTPYGEKVQSAITGLNIFNKKYTGQVDDSTTEEPDGLMYYNARYYDPAIGRFISPDSMVPHPGYSQSYNRFMYVVGNPITFNDPSGFSMSDAAGSVGGAISGAAGGYTGGDVGSHLGSGGGGHHGGVKLGNTGVNNLTVGSSIGETVGSQLSTYKATGSVVYGVAGSTVGAIAGAIWGAIIGFCVAGVPGMIAGMKIGAAAGGIIGGINGALAGYNDTYSHDGRGVAAFILDSSWSLPITAIGLAFFAYLTIGGAKLDSKYSCQSNAFVFTNVAGLLPAPGLTLGNVFAVEMGVWDKDFLETARHELTHTWQYRIGGVLAALKLGQEQIMGPYNLNIYNPYQTPKNLEYQAYMMQISNLNNRPYILQGDNFNNWF